MIIEFNPTSKNIAEIKQIIKDQGDTVCQDQMSIETIRDQISSFDFGFIQYSEKAKIGKKHSKKFSDNYILDGFIVCSIVPDDDYELEIKIVCSRKHSRIGKTLMEMVEEHSISIGIERIMLFALPEPRLKKWYESLGYKHITDITMKQDGKRVVKVHMMRKTF